MNTETYTHMAPPQTLALNAAHLKKTEATVRHDTEGAIGAFELFFLLLPYLVRRDMEHPVEFLNSIMGGAEDLESAFGDYIDFYNAIVLAYEDFEAGKSQHHLKNNLLKLLPQKLPLEECQNRWAPTIMTPVKLFLDEYGIPSDTIEEMMPEVNRRFGEATKLSERLANLLFVAQMFYLDEAERKDFEKKLQLGLGEVIVILVESVLDLMIDFIALRKLHGADHGLKVDTFSPGGASDEAFAQVGRNDPCPCGSGKKFKKCCMNRLKNPMSTLSAPKILGKKALTREEVEEFYYCYDLLMTHVQNDYAKVFGVPALDHLFTKQEDGTYCFDFYMQETKVIQEVRRHLVGNPFLIDTLLESLWITEQERDVITQWKGFIFAPMLIMQTTAGGQAIAWKPDIKTLYYVYGLYDPLYKIVPSLPYYCELLLLPFKGRIVYDGLLAGSQIEFGDTMLRGFVEEYSALLQSSDVVMSLR